MQIEPQKEHQWLEQLLGEWTYESEAVMEPGKPPMKFNGQETVRSLGGVWILCEGRGATPGGEEIGRTIMTLGYDPQKRQYVGTFIGSMMTHLWSYVGQTDSTGSVLTLDTEGPSFTSEGKMSKFQDVIEIKPDGRRSLSSRILADDGKWITFMTATYRRVG